MSIESDKLDALYKRLKPAGVTMTALLAKAVGNALVKHPVMFASEGGTGPCVRRAAHAVCCACRVLRACRPAHAARCACCAACVQVYAVSWARR
jgi:hypothetical protein